MVSSKDDGKKDPLRGSDPKRPHATLDLKAVEVKPPEKKEDAKATEASGPASKQTGTAGSSDSKAPEIKPVSGLTTKPEDSASAAKDTTKDAAKDVKPAAAAAATSAASAAASVPKVPPASDARQPSPPPPARRGGGIGGFFTHIAAGIVGGFLALVGGDALMKQTGLHLGTKPQPQLSEEVARRLGALETAVRAAPSGADADLGEKLAAQAARIDKLQATETRMVEIADAHAKLQAETHALAKRLAEAPAGGGSPDPRIGKLEEKLSLLSSAAEGSQGAAAIPQLAAVTGKLSDLEATLGNQLSALRKSVTEEIETRIAKAAEAAEAARSGTQRVDRELSDVKTDAARITQRLETLKADNQRFSDALAAAQAEAGKVSSALDALRSDVGQRFKSVAKPDDVAAAVAPVTARLDGIEKRVDTVVTAEQSRKASAERIVLSLELANLKRAVDRGIGYADELAQVKKAAGGKIDLAALEPSKSEGVPTLTELQASFRPLSHQIIDAASEPADGGVVDRLLAGAKSIVRVRKVDHRPDDDSVEAVVGRMDRALEEGRITDFVSLAEKLPARAKAPAAGLMQKVEARHAVDKALAEIQTQLKATLGSAGEAASATAK